MVTAVRLGGTCYLVVHLGSMFDDPPLGGTIDPG